MSQEKLQTMSMQNFWGVKEVHHGIVQVVNDYGTTYDSARHIHGCHGSHFQNSDFSLTFRS